MNKSLLSLDNTCYFKLHSTWCTVVINCTQNVCQISICAGMCACIKTALLEFLTSMHQIQSKHSVFCSCYIKKVNICLLIIIQALIEHSIFLQLYTENNNDPVMQQISPTTSHKKWNYKHRLYIILYFSIHWFVHSHTYCYLWCNLIHTCLNYKLKG
jgi:hypothetical protein